MEVSNHIHSLDVTRWLEGWVGPRACLDAVAWRKIPAPSENRTTAVQSIV